MLVTFVTFYFTLGATYARCSENESIINKWLSQKGHYSSDFHEIKCGLLELINCGLVEFFQFFIFYINNIQQRSSWALYQNSKQVKLMSDSK